MQAAIRCDVSDGWTVEEAVPAGRVLTIALGQMSGFVAGAPDYSPQIVTGEVIVQKGL